MQTNLPLSADLAGVPFIDQYVGAWALWEPHARTLMGAAENINLQIHLEQHAPQSLEPKGAAVVAADGMSGMQVARGGLAIVELRGTLMKHASSFSGGTSTVRARRQIRAAAASDDIAGIMLVCDSPGGTVAGTADLGADIAAAAAKKPVHAYVEDLCASACYWCAAQASRISAGSSSITGSIGVFSVVYDLARMAENDGVKVHVVRFGKFKGAGTPGTEITAEQLDRWQRIVDAHGEDFVAVVAAGRRMSAEKARELADGDVWKGAEAKKRGLVDSIESFDEALAKLAAATRKTKSTARAQAMSEANEVAAVVGAELKELKPAAATLAELREACPGAGSDFLLEQLEKSATVTTAMKAHAKLLADENAKLAAERDELKAAQAAETSSPAAGAKPRRGNQPLENAIEGSETTSTAGSAEAFEALFQAKQAAGLSRQEAMRQAAHEDPAGREAWVAEHNEKHLTTDAAKRLAVSRR